MSCPPNRMPSDVVPFSSSDSCTSTVPGTIPRLTSSSVWLPPSPFTVICSSRRLSSKSCTVTRMVIVRSCAKYFSLEGLSSSYVMDTRGSPDSSEGGSVSLGDVSISASACAGRGVASGSSYPSIPSSFSPVSALSGSSPDGRPSASMLSPEVSSSPPAASVPASGARSVSTPLLSLSDKDPAIWPDGSSSSACSICSCATAAVASAVPCSCARPGKLMPPTASRKLSTIHALFFTLCLICLSFCSCPCPDDLVRMHDYFALYDPEPT